jgi:hypothetical protein
MDEGHCGLPTEELIPLAEKLLEVPPELICAALDLELQEGGHSLRAGFLTSAASRGASIFKMMDVSRHRSVDTLRGYVRDAELFKDHAGAGLL